MGANFVPQEKHIAELNRAVVSLEEILHNCTKSIKKFAGVDLIVHSLTSPKDTLDPIARHWHYSYNSISNDCMLKLRVAFKGGIMGLTRGHKEVRAKTQLTKMPACCGVCVMNGMDLHQDFRSNGVGKAFTKVVEAFAKTLNYSYIICTVQKFNGPAVGVLKSLGYERLDGFANMRTKNTVEIYGKNINPNGITLTDGYIK